MQTKNSKLAILIYFLENLQIEKGVRANINGELNWLIWRTRANKTGNDLSLSLSLPEICSMLLKTV